MLDDAPEHLALCPSSPGGSTSSSVLSHRPWQVGHARNLALRQVNGDVVVLMDVDMALPARCLQDLYDTHFGYGQRICVVGQMIDYDNNTGDVPDVDAPAVRALPQSARRVAGHRPGPAGPADDGPRT